MKRILDFLDRIMSAVYQSLEDRPASRLTTESGHAAVISQSRNTDCREQPRDTIQILDISGSMDCPDYPPTRLAGGIEAAIEYINSRAAQCPQDRIAIVTFSTRARIVLPLTPIDEKETIVAALEQLRADGETDIAKGLQAAIRIFDEEPLSDRLRQITLLTDGHGGDPIRKAASLKEQYGATIYVVGIGGTRKDVNESLLRKLATSDHHYRFIRDSETLKQHYRQLATGLVWRGDQA